MDWPIICPAVKSSAAQKSFDSPALGLNAVRVRLASISSAIAVIVAPTTSTVTASATRGAMAILASYPQHEMPVRVHVQRVARLEQRGRRGLLDQRRPAQV